MKATSDQITALWWKHSPMRTAHWHNDVELALAPEGSFAYFGSDGLVEIGRGRLCVFWGTYPHRAVSAPKEGSVGVLHIPLEEFLCWQIPGDLTLQILRGRFIVAGGGREEIDTLQMKLWIDDLNSARADGRHDRVVAAEIAARLNRVSLRHQQVARSKRPHPSAVKPAFLAAMHLAKDYVLPLRIADVARTAGVHPASLSPLFRKALGVSPREFLNRLRIARAQELLLTTHFSILEIALACGFQSSNRFYLGFRNVVGCPPSVYRSRIRERVNYESSTG